MQQSTWRAMSETAVPHQCSDAEKDDAVIAFNLHLVQSLNKLSLKLKAAKQDGAILKKFALSAEAQDDEEHDDGITSDEESIYMSSALYYDEQEKLSRGGKSVGRVVGGSQNTQTQMSSSYQPKVQVLSRYSPRIKLEKYVPTTNMSSQATNRLVNFYRRQEAERVRVLDPQFE